MRLRTSAWSLVDSLRRSLATGGADVVGSGTARKAAQIPEDLGRKHVKRRAGELLAHAAGAARLRRAAPAGAGGRPRLLVGLEVRRFLELILGHRGLQLGR